MATFADSNWRALHAGRTTMSDHDGFAWITAAHRIKTTVGCTATAATISFSKSLMTPSPMCPSEINTAVRHYIDFRSNLCNLQSPQRLTRETKNFGKQVCSNTPALPEAVFLRTTLCLAPIPVCGSMLHMFLSRIWFPKQRSRDYLYANWITV